MNNKPTTEITDVVSRMRDGKLTQAELDQKIAKFERDGQLIEFSSKVVNMVEQYLKNEGRSNDILASQVQTMNQILVDKDCTLQEKLLAHQKLREINEQLRSKSMNNSIIVLGVIILAAAIIGACICNSNKNR